MNRTESWFQSEVYQKRVLFAFASFLLVLSLALILFSTFIWVALSLPGFGFPESSNNVSCSIWGNVTHFLLLAGGASIIFLFHLSRWSIEAKIPTRRIQALWECISPTRTLHQVAYILISSLAAHCFLVLSLNSSPWSQKIEGGPWFYEERHWFTTGAGLYLGALYCLRYYSQGLYLVDFPVVQQKRLPAIKYSLRQQVRESLVSPSFWLYWYYLIYFCLGSIIKSFIHTFFNLKSLPNEESLSSWTGLLDPSLLAITWLTCSFLHWVWTSLVILVQEIFTQHVEFVISTEFEATHHHSLSSCLSADNKYIKFLAFLDLKHVAQNSPERREEIFAISTPGGRPKHWPSIATACLKMIKNFLTQLESPTQPTTAPTKKPVPAELPYPHPGLRRIHIYQPSLATSLSSTPPQPPPTVIQVLKTKVVEWWNQRPLIQFLFNEVPEAKVRKVFSQCQPVIWAIEALCFLVKASHSEDTFGVVQKNLSEILTTLLSLQMVVDRHPGGAMRRPALLARRDAQLRHGLKTALNSGLYHITLAFGRDLIQGVPLSEEHKHSLEQYLAFTA